MLGSEEAQIIRLTLAVLLLLFGYVYMYRRTRCRRLREDIFTIRDDLFDYMWKNGLPYDLPAYRLTRDLLNGVIRFAPWMTFINIGLLKNLHRHRRLPSELREAIQAIESAENREHFHAVLAQTRYRVNRFLYLEGVQWIVSRLLVGNLLKERPPYGTDDSATEAAVAKPRWQPQVRVLEATISEETELDFISLGKPDSWLARIFKRASLTNRPARA